MKAGLMSDTPQNSGYFYRQDRDVAWAGKFPVFRTSSPDEILTALKGFVHEASSQQVTAWENSITSLQSEVGHILDSDEKSKDYSALLEYIMPLEARRSDGIFLLNGRVLVLEYKGYAKLEWADIDQARHYLISLKNYHKECHGRDVDAVLVLMGGKMSMVDHTGVHICGPTEVHNLVTKLCAESKNKETISLESFTSADSYQPAPALLKGIRQILKEKKLVRVHKAAAKTDEALATIENIVENTAKQKRRSLILLSGAPGTGKTLVGIRSAVSEKINKLAVPREGRETGQAAIFLSGNGPLISVLKHEFKKFEIDARALVRGVKDYVDYYSRRNRVPLEHLLIFDEAQRAWDINKVQDKHKDPSTRSFLKSEPEMFINFSERVPGWCTVLGLIGGGQEIHSGEEGGIRQWAESIKNSPNSETWDIYGPPQFTKVFQDAGLANQYKSDQTLFLDRSIRFSSAVYLHEWVEGLVDEKLPDDKLRELASKCRDEGVVMRVTRNLDVAKRYLWGRFIKDPEARFGLIISSRDKALGGHGVPQIGKFAPIGEWYVEDELNPNSCRRLREAITQFEAQGLEMDAALVCWGNDFLWSNQSQPDTDRDAKYPETNWDDSRAKKWLKKSGEIFNRLGLRRNTYRVLLTRGRQGSVIFVPPQPEFNDTYEKLIRAGCETLDKPVDF